MDSSMKSNTPAAESSAAGLDPSADQVMTAAAEAAEPLDAILRQIIGGYFVLTDGQGSVSKWSEPAELLFGRPAAEVLGQSFFQTLIQSPAPAAAESWRGFLEAGEAPTPAGRVEGEGLHDEGTSFSMEAVFVPVKLDEGFDFSLFLEDLGFELPIDMMLLRMRQQHPVVVRALRTALEPGMQPWEGLRTAGTLVAFRPLEPTPWMDAAMERREREREEAEVELQSRIEALEAPMVQGSDVYDLDDARAVIDRLRWATERIEDLEERSRIMERATARPQVDGEELLARLDDLERLAAAAEEARREAAQIAAVEAQAAIERA